MTDWPTWLEGLGRALYWYCVDFVIHVANLTGLTYRDVNAALFLVVWPLVTAGLVAVVVYQAVVLRRLRERRET